MKIKIILLLIFLISCGSETSTENFNHINDAGELIDVTSDGGYIVFSDTDSKGSKEPNNFGFLYIKNP